MFPYYIIYANVIYMSDVMLIVVSRRYKCTDYL